MDILEKFKNNKNVVVKKMKNLTEISKIRKSKDKTLIDVLILNTGFYLIYKRVKKKV
jgi:hypothetical protein